MAKGKKNKGGKEKTEKIIEKTIVKDKVHLQPVSEEEAEKILPPSLEEELVYRVSEFFKVFGDPTRVKMLRLLLTGELCVGDIAERLSMTQSAVSHQLRVLRQNNLVKYRKEGKTVYYSLDDEHVRTVLEQGIRHVQHKKEI